MVKITGVEPHSRAEKAKITVGDILVSINGHDITDVLDYRFYLAECEVLLSLERNGERFAVKIKKSEYDDIGLDFETPLMDKKHSCTNKCIFCFIDQLPKGMRDSLYFKDDDSRLSFLHGNYITMTNLTERDIDRIIEMHISPVNVSVHTTDPELRVKMMKNKHAGEVLSYLRKLADAGIALCCQIVLCRSINDGAALDRTMRDLLEYFPALRSVSIVPAGMTKFRDGLYPLEPFSAEECRNIIAQVDAFAETCRQKHGTRLFFCADEFYIKGKLDIPNDEYYEDYSQLENGVGMLRLLEKEFNFETDFIGDYIQSSKLSLPRTVSVATGVASYEHILSLTKKAERLVDGLKINVYCIKNNFFGEQITVSGLLTGVDMAEQLSGKELGDELLIPSNTLRAEGDLFLCGMTPDELSSRLGVPVTPSKNDGSEFFLALLGIESDI